MADTTESGASFMQGLLVSITGGVLSAMIVRSLTKSSTTEVLEAVSYVKDTGVHSSLDSLRSDGGKSV